MKKILLTLIVLSIGFAVKAQIQVGVKAGLNVANLKTSGPDYVNGTSPSALNSFNGGLIVLVPLFSNFYLQPEIYYSFQGQNVSGMDENSISKYDYLNIPVLFKYQLKNGAFAETGPQIGFLMSEKFTSGSFSYDPNRIKNIDFSWAFGLGYKLKTIPLGLDLRYNLGLTNNYQHTESGVVKNSVYQIDLFYLFNLKSP